MTDANTGELRDVHKQFKRLLPLLDTPDVLTNHPAVQSAAAMLDRALEKATRVPHKAVRQQDEMFCYECGCRWGADEPEPEASCEPDPTLRIERIKKQITGIEMTGRITGREGDQYKALQKELRRLTTQLEEKDGDE